MADSPKIDWIRIAISSQLVMLIYFTIDNHIDLYPWNNLRSPVAEHARWLDSVSFDHVDIRLSCALGHGRGNNLCVRVVAVANQAVVDSLSAWSTPLHRDFSWYYEHGYTETLKALPPIGDHPVPDLQHIFLQLLSLVVAVTATIGCYESWKAS